MSANRYVICGVSPLSLAVATLLRNAPDGHEVVAVLDRSGEEWIVKELEAVAVKSVPMSGDRESALAEAGAADASCLLALSDDPVENARSWPDGKSLLT